MKLTVEMPWERDLSVNHCRMGPQGNWHLKRHVESWMYALGWEIVAEAMNQPKPVLPLHVVVDCRFPDKRKRDSHNFHYVIANAVAAGLGIDDKDIRISTGSVTVDRERPGFLITVEDGK